MTIAGWVLCTDFSLPAPSLGEQGHDKASVGAPPKCRNQGVFDWPLHCRVTKAHKRPLPFFNGSIALPMMVPGG